MKFCKDCKFYKAENPPLDSSYWSKCTNPETQYLTLNPITGEQAGFEYCESARNDLYKTCGKEARFFEPRESNIISFRCGDSVQIRELK